MVFDVLGRLYTHKQRWLPIPQPIDGSWRPPAYSAKAKAAPDGWTCDFFVPFAGFEGNPVPKAGDEWNFNFVRNKLSASREVTGNSLTLGSNHNRAMFGILRFLCVKDRGRGEWNVGMAANPPWCRPSLVSSLCPPRPFVAHSR